MRKQGFTVPEVLVAGLILLVVIGVMFQLLLPSFSLFRSQMAYSQAHQNVLLTSQRVKRDLSNTTTSTFTLADTGTAFCFAPKDPNSPFDSSGKTRYAREFVVYYLTSEQKVVRKRWPAGSESAPAGLFDGPDPPRLSKTQLDSVQISRNGTERVLATDVTQFLLSDGGTDPVLLEPPFVLQLRCEVATDSEKTEDYEVRVEVAPRTIGW